MAFGAMAALQRRLQEAQQEPEPPKIHTAEELDAYVKERISELDSLIQECEKQIAELTLKKDKEIRAWFMGALKGLQLAREAWSWWEKNTG